MFSLFNPFKLLWSFISCPYKHPEHLTKVYLPHLQLPDGSRKIVEPCDILFFHGHSIPLNQMIQYYTNCAINHAARFLGGRKHKDGTYTYEVFHSVGRGVCIEPLQKAWEDSDKYILVYRYYKDGKTLSFAQRDAIIDSCNKYYKNRTKYAVGELFELAVLSRLGRETAPYGVRKALDSALQVLNSIIEGNSEPVTCYELMDRTNAEGGAPIGYLPSDIQRSFQETEDEMLLLMKELRYDYDKDFLTPADGYLRSLELKPIGMLVKEF